MWYDSNDFSKKDKSSLNNNIPEDIVGTAFTFSLGFGFTSNSESVSLTSKVRSGGSSLQNSYLLTIHTRLQSNAKLHKINYQYINWEIWF